MDVYQELKTWQTAIGAAFGLIALMTGALWNFHLNRRRDAHLRAEEALSVTAALYGEIILLRQEAARLAVAVTQVLVNRGTQRNPIIKFDTHFLEANTLPEPTLYKALAPKLGLLSADMVVAVTRFHASFQAMKAGLPLLLENKERGYSHSVLNVLLPARDVVQGVVTTLRQMERILSISIPPQDPDFGLTDTVIEMEEASYTE